MNVRRARREPVIEDDPARNRPNRLDIPTEAPTQRRRQRHAGERRRNPLRPGEDRGHDDHHGHHDAPRNDRVPVDGRQGVREIADQLV